MKKLISKLFIAIMLLTCIIGYSQKTYNYVSVPKDPYKARIYQLDNGLTVYLSVYKDAPKIQCDVAVKTGGKNDPADNTGLSHYLEHLMFKGTDKFGTADFSKEEPLLNEIERLIVLAGDDPMIEAESLSERISTAPAEGRKASKYSGKLKDAIEALERDLISEGLKNNNWNKSKLAKSLGISRANLISKVDKYGLDKRKAMR